jgi:amino acid transporter
MHSSGKGLRAGTISQWEAIGQSLANIAPTAAPAMAIPFILAISGNGSWLACLVALLAMACVAHQINLFARRSSSSGSLYQYVDESIGRKFSLITAWALLIAYIGTGCAVTGGLIVYTYSLLGGALTTTVLTTIIIAILAVTLAGYLAYRDVHISARMMLVIELISILFILALFSLPGPRNALHWDRAQLLLSGVTLKQVRGGLVLAIFGFVGFESAASLGAEAVNPLKTIPRAITSTALISGFAGYDSQLAASGAPLTLLAGLRHWPSLAPLITATTICSFFACTLACVTAGSRVLYKLSQDGHFHATCGRAHDRHATPHIAIVIVGATVLVTTVSMTLGHIVPFDIYGLAGTFATYGFITAYLLVSVGAVVLLYRTRTFTTMSIISLVGSFGILTLTAAGSVSSAEGAYRWLPYLYLALLVVAAPLLFPRRVNVFVHSKT